MGSWVFSGLEDARRRFFQVRLPGFRILGVVAMGGFPKIRG